MASQPDFSANFDVEDNNSKSVRPEGSRTESTLTGITLVASRPAQILEEPLTEEADECGKGQSPSDNSQGLVLDEIRPGESTTTLQRLSSNTNNFQSQSALDILQVCGDKTGTCVEAFMKALETDRQDGTLASPMKP